MCAALEVARAVTGQDPFNKWPKRDGIFYVVAKDGKEIGQVLWKKLARAGAFKMIRDEETKLWRAFRPFDPRDAARAHEWKPVPPLISPRFIKDIAWESKRENIPKIARFTTGWEIYFYSAEARPPHGSDIDGAWFDEEVTEEIWYTEVSARLVDRCGKFIWSATPQTGTEQLYALHERAEADASEPPHKRAVEEFHVTLDDNVHISEQQKRQFIAKLSEDERMVRVGGEFAMLATIIYPEFSRAVHEVEYFDVPATWTRYVAIDPGRQICAALFMAIPPPAQGDYAYVYDEIYIPNCNAAMFAEKMQEKCAAQQMQAFIIDYQEARKHETGSGRTIEDQYSAALRGRRVYSKLTGPTFIHGDPNLKAGIEAVRDWLRTREPLGPKLRVIGSKCPNFMSEIKKYRYKRMNSKQGWITTDEPETRGRVHQMATLRYLVQYNPQYSKPDPPREANYVLKAIERKRKKNRHGKMVLFG